MKRGLVWCASLMLALMAVTGVARAENYDFKAGTDYTVLKTQIKDPGTKGAFVLEYMWLGCPHCRALNPLVQEFEKSHPEVKIERRPAVGNERWVFDAHVFYGLYGMGHSDLLYDIMDYYAQIAHDERRLPDGEDLKQYLRQKNIDPDKFMQVMNSEDTLKKLSASYKDQQTIGAKGVPVFLVNGKYQIRFEALTKAKDPKAQFIALVEYLLKQG
ncbi:hypothetical protein HR45_13395 [Shewanella mangrovi]|uniref:Thiol:disulfide interchange protein n=1 Tax=Shewanella mangrovi TaxID=1515746 RepID=A0A094JAU2_9GAMM|nr:DsbA family protein [Shewanella mangrovi]KFZ37030.1 hypothetical protein HR45_13395 [Shewanella mangrovi]